MEKTRLPKAGDQQLASHLEDAHAEGVAEDLVGLGVVAVADGGGRHEELEGVLLLGVQQAPLSQLLYLPHALLLVTAMGAGRGSGWLTLQSSRFETLLL